MKKNYEMPLIEVVEVSNDDIIMDSTEVDFGDLLGSGE